MSKMGSHQRRSRPDGKMGAPRSRRVRVKWGADAETVVPSSVQRMVEKFLAARKRRQRDRVVAESERQDLQ